VLNAPGDRREEDFDAIAKAAAPHFDRVILRDDEDLRGREPGEVTAPPAEGTRPPRHAAGRHRGGQERAGGRPPGARHGRAGRPRRRVRGPHPKVAAQIDFERQKADPVDGDNPVVRDR
jgi:hypothetical protein